MLDIHDPHLCVDVNECDGNPCDIDATCDNTAGSFTCTCMDGFTGNGVTCSGKDRHCISM